jgi:hypothetical protein
MRTISSTDEEPAIASEISISDVEGAGEFAARAGRSRGEVASKQHWTQKSKFNEEFWFKFCSAICTSTSSLVPTCKIALSSYFQLRFLVLCSRRHFHAKLVTHNGK